MQEHPVLGQIIVGHSPLIDRQRAVVATRLTVFPENPVAPPDARALLEAVRDAFPPSAAEDGLTLTLRPLDVRGGSAPAMPAGASIGTPVLLNIGHEALLDAVMASHPGPHLLVEVPAFMVADAARAQQLRALQQAGQPLAITGRPVAELPKDLLPCFRHAIVDLADERRTGADTPAGSTRTITTISAGARTMADVESAFQRGAWAVLGWPVEGEVPKSGRSGLAPDLRAIVELMKRVDAEEPAERMEPVLKNDPTLAFRLLRYINSAAFGLRVEVTSFKHALMLLGYVRLKRWLALLLAGASKDAAMRPLMHAAVRRGFLLEELARGLGDEEMRSELFICGVFSLLDRMLRQPFSELLDNVPVPERVRSSLAGDDGPYAAHLELARAVERGSPVDIRECADRLLIGPGEVSRAVFAALAAARQID
jgi:EAL and modified HD-GYP domain-containing signal transduction protein